MAVIVAAASGNWSSTGTWLGGALPQDGDDVYANTFTVTIDQSINVASLNNATYSAPRDNPTMTSNTTPSGTASASSIESSTYDAWRAFDGSTAGATNNWRAAAATTTGWIQYEYTSSRIINRYTISSNATSASNNPFTWTFEGWNGSSWDVLHTVTSQVIALAGTYDSGVLANTTSYSRYRHNITAINGGTQLQVGEIIYYRRGFERNSTAGGLFDATTAGTTLTITGATPFLANTASTVFRASNATGTVTMNITNSWAAPTSVGGLQHTGNGDFSCSFPQINGSVITNVSSLARTGTGTLTLTGNIQGNLGSASNTTVPNTGSGTVNIIGNLIGGTSTNSGQPFSSTNATVNVTGNITGGNSGGAVGCTISSGSISVTGAVTAGNGIGLNTAVNATIIGNVTGATGDAIFSSVGVTITVTGNITGSSSGGCGVTLTNRSAQLNLTGNLVNASNVMAVWVPKLTVSNSATTSWALFTLTPSARTLYSDDTFPNLPAVGNVRSGITYGPGGSNTGTLAVPSPSNVLLGVATDNTTGTYSTTPTAIATEIFTKLLSNSDFNTSGSFGKLVKDNLDAQVSTRLSTAGYTAPPSVSAIRTEMDTNSTKLDVAVSTRLASASYTAPDNSSITAIKAKTDNLPADPASESNVNSKTAEIKKNTDLIPASL